MDMNNDKTSNGDYYDNRLKLEHMKSELTFTDVPSDGTEPIEAEEENGDDYAI